MGDQRVRHFPFAQGAKHALEIIRRRVAAAEQRRLTLVKLRIVKADIAGNNGHEDIGAAVTDEGKPALHGFRIACRIKNRIEEIASGDFGQTILVTVAEVDNMSDTEVFLAEIEPVGATVDHRHFRTIENGEDSNRHTDRAGTDDQDLLPFFNGTAPHRMRADRQEFRHGRLVEAQPLRLQHELLRYAQIFHHAAIAMDAEHTDIAAAIALAFQAGITSPAGHIGDDGHHIAGGKMAAFGRLINRAGKFMAHDTWIGEIGLVAGEDMQIRTANADPANTHQHFTFATHGFRQILGG